VPPGALHFEWFDHQRGRGLGHLARLDGACGWYRLPERLPSHKNADVLPDVSPTRGGQWTHRRRRRVALEATRRPAPTIAARNLGSCLYDLWPSSGLLPASLSPRGLASPICGGRVWTTGLRRCYPPLAVAAADGAPWGPSGPARGWSLRAPRLALARGLVLRLRGWTLQVLGPVSGENPTPGDPPCILRPFR
jgi:hypothetical protein